MNNFRIAILASLFVVPACLSAQEPRPADPELQQKISDRKAELEKLNARDAEPSIFLNQSKMEFSRGLNSGEDTCFGTRGPRT